MTEQDIRNPALYPNAIEFVERDGKYYLNRDVPKYAKFSLAFMATFPGLYTTSHYGHLAVNFEEGSVVYEIIDYDGLLFYGRLIE